MSDQSKDLRFVAPDQRSAEGAIQTSGMLREAGVSPRTTGSELLWFGVVTTLPGDASGVHHHGEAESGLLVLSGGALIRWGPGLEREQLVGIGDFIYVPPYALHQEVNASAVDPVIFAVARNRGLQETINVDWPSTDRTAPDSESDS